MFNPTKYSLIWWFQTGKAWKNQDKIIGTDSLRNRVARHFFPHLAFRLGYALGK